MDYSVKDSSVHDDPHAFKEHYREDNAIRIGIVREERKTTDGETRYIAEVFMSGIQIPISCQCMTRFGGPYNFEEFRLKPWIRGATAGLLAPSTAGTYSYRDGDVVLVALLNGKSREGVILGSMRHPKRAEQTIEGELSYISCYNGVETKIDKEGAYTITFNGAPLNDLSPSVPGTDLTVLPVAYNPAIAGSYYGFDSSGGFTISDGQVVPGTGNSIVITKNPFGPSTVITSGNSVISMTGSPFQGQLSITTDFYTSDTIRTTFKAVTDFNVETLQIKLKGQQVAIGNDTIELVDTLITLIKTLGNVVVTSPVGTCTPLMTDTTGGWASEIIPMLIKLSALKGSL